jgi:hypothetical protein
MLVGSESKSTAQQQPDGGSRDGDAPFGSDVDAPARRGAFRTHRPPIGTAANTDASPILRMDHHPHERSVLS